jgi:DNA replicative helicase MCM subunit Mcm2 (Cdc46/Mcm family)
MKCAWKICIKEVKPGRRFCSPKCKGKFFVDKRRKDLKQKSLDYKGNSCQLCGYDKCQEALVFHHLNTGKKGFAISVEGYTRSWEKIKRELDKCILVCANCHAEIHHRQRMGETLGEKSGEFGESLVRLIPSRAQEGIGS